MLYDAGRQLLLTDRPVNEIAGESGFVNANYFSRLFRASKGVSPSEYRADEKNLHIPGQDAEGP